MVQPHPRQARLILPSWWNVRWKVAIPTMFVLCRYSERMWACAPHPHQAGLIFPSWWNVRQKVAIATLCVVCTLNLSSGPSDLFYTFFICSTLFKEIFSKSILNNDSTLCKLKKVRKGTYSKMMQKFNKLNSEHKGKCIVYILQLFETYSIEHSA
jgi:hypothetical protein